MKKHILAAAVALTLAFSGALSQARAATPSATISAAVKSTQAAALGHHRRGCFKQNRRWVCPKYGVRPVFDCHGRLRGYRKVLLRQGYWKSCHVRANFKRGCR